MRITRISVAFTETCNLGDYSNTKPSVELTADVDIGDDVQAVIATLGDLAKATLHAKIDEELELVGRSPKYFAGPLFSVYRNNQPHCVLIVPAGEQSARGHTVLSSVRYEVARKKAEEYSERGALIFAGAYAEFIAYIEQADAERKRVEEARRVYDEKRRFEQEFPSRVSERATSSSNEGDWDGEDEEGKAGDQGE